MAKKTQRPLTPARGNSDRFEDRFVAFIDILGFQDLLTRIARGRSDLFDEIKNSLESILAEERELDDPDSVRRAFSPTRQMTCFSDHVVISDVVDRWFSLLLAARKLYTKLLSKGILCRGAIARGSTFHHGRIIFGQGLVRAYELESRAAIYPRVIVIDEIRKRLVNSDSQSKFNVRFASMLIRDHDGLWLIDPFGRPRVGEAYREGENPEEITRHALTAQRSRIIDGFVRAKKRRLHLGQIAKHRWLARQFNETLAAERRTSPAQIRI